LWSGWWSLRHHCPRAAERSLKNGVQPRQPAIIRAQPLHKPDPTIALSIEWWERELGRALGEALFGENLTVGGLAVSGAVIGEEWSLGSVLMQVAQPRLPCSSSGCGWAIRGFSSGSWRPGVRARTCPD
jgi:hypothetical protein